MEDIKKGMTINNRYTLIEYKGSGSFGEVWRAKDKQFQGRDIAIKIYISLNRQGCEEFLDEYKIASGLSHRNLLVTEHYDLWQNRPYLTMKYCANGSAANLVGKLTPSPAHERLIWRFIRDVSAGLTYLHNLTPDPIVHQDIKPDNVLMDADGTFMITDFGISKRVRNTLRSQSTRAQKAGATAYMAPERFSNHPNPILASDIWSLGVSIFELAEGELPFAGMGGIMLKNGADMVDLNEGWTQNLNDIMHFCLEKESWDRGKAHEICEIANKVLESDLKLNVAKAIQQIKDNEGASMGNVHPNDKKQDKGPRSTRRKVSNSGSQTLKQETTPSGDSSTRQQAVDKNGRKSKIIKMALLSLAAVMVGFVIFYGLFFEDSKTKNAKLNQDKYAALVGQCKQDIEQGSGNNTQALLDAKTAFAGVVELEKQYAEVLPSFYNKSQVLEGSLEPKLIEAAVAWARAAKMQVDNLNDYQRAIEFYQLAISLFDNDSIKQEYLKVAKAVGFLYIKECKFRNENATGAPIDAYGKELQAKRMKYLQPLLFYDGLEGCTERQIDLFVKIIRPDGNLEKGSSSPQGFTYKDKVHVEKGKNKSIHCSGWGAETSIFSKGTYSIEFWYNNKQIYSTTVDFN